MYWLAAVLAFLLFLAFLPIRLWVDYKHRGKSEDTLLVHFSTLWGLVEHSTEVPVVKGGRNKLSLASKATKKKFTLSRPSLAELAGYWQDYQEIRRAKISRLFRRNFKIRQLTWHTELGLEDSDRLAVLTGGLWAVKGLVVAGLYHVFSFSAPPVIRVLPRFNRNYFRLSVSCILEFPLGYAIITAFYAGFLAVKLILKRRSGKKSDRTSNPGPDEDSNGKHQGNGRCEHGNR